jgi:hypothetical protein
MDVDAQSGVADDLLAALAARVGGVLAFPPLNRTDAGWY